MHRRRLSGLDVSAIGLGCMGLSGTYGPADEAESIRTIHRALDLGMDFIDTADVYGNGHNETLVGRALGNWRGTVVLATKFGNVTTPDGRQEVDGSPDYVRKACDASLRRLGTDVIDLYYAHRIDPRVPVEDTIGALKGLVEAGKIRHVGLSEAGAATIRRAHAVHPVAALQSEWSLWTRDLEAEVAPLCRALGIGFVAYSPLGRGFLGGTIGTAGDLAAQDRRHAHPRFAPDAIVRNRRLIEPLADLARAKGVTPAQVALAWLLAQQPDVVPIPGTRRVARLEENAAATAVTLSADEIAALSAAFPPGAAAGTRYPADGMQRLGL